MWRVDVCGCCCTHAGRSEHAPLAGKAPCLYSALVINGNTCPFRLLVFVQFYNFQVFIAPLSFEFRVEAASIELTAGLRFLEDW